MASYVPTDSYDPTCRIEVTGAWSIKQIDPQRDMPGKPELNLRGFLHHYERAVRHLSFNRRIRFHWTLSNQPGHLHARCRDGHRRCRSVDRLYKVTTDTDRAHYAALNLYRQELKLRPIPVPPYAREPSVATALGEISRLIRGKPMTPTKPPARDRPMPTQDRSRQAPAPRDEPTLQLPRPRRYTDTPYRD